MQVMIGEQMMRTVVVVGAAKPMRLKLHHFGLFGVGEACIIWTRVRVQSVRVMLAWPKTTVAIYVPDALYRNLIRNCIDQVGRILRPTVFPRILFGGTVSDWELEHTSMLRQSIEVPRCLSEEEGIVVWGTWCDIRLII